MKKSLRLGASVIALAALIGGCANFEALQAKPTATQNQTVEPSQEAKTEEPPTEEPELTLAADVETAALEGNGVSTFVELGETSPAFAVTGLENVNIETIRVNVQEQLADSEAEELARWFANMTCEQNPDLNGIVIRDTSGVDRNYYAAKLSALPACQG